MQMAGLQYSIPIAKGTKILFADACGLVILDKPEGVLSTPNTPSDLNKTLVRAKFSKKEESYVWFDQDQVKRHFYICHRLDSPTSGLLIGATDERVAMRIRELFKLRRIQKTYVAVVYGAPHGKNGVWKDRLKTASSEDRSHVRTKISGSGDESSTGWKAVRHHPSKRLTFLELQPHTGRTHQLRVQTAFHLLPIVGDRTYGDFKLNARAKKEWGVGRLMLHAHRVELQDKTLKLNLNVESPVPLEFSQLFDK